MEYRAWINIPNLPFAEEQVWGPFISFLEESYGEFGPVLGWDTNDLANVVMATDAESPSEAAQMLFDAVAVGLRGADLTDRYPSAVRIELVEDELVAV